MWRKLGLVFAGPNGTHPALRSHAALPVPFPLGGDLVRVFYSGRDGANRSAVGSVVLRLGETPQLEEDRGEPILLPGGIGAFDDAGIGIGCIVPGEVDRLYYMGWNIGGSAPWRNAIGVAFGHAREARFERDFVGPAARPFAGGSVQPVLPLGAAERVQATGACGTAPIFQMGRDAGRHEPCHPVRAIPPTA